MNAGAADETVRNGLSRRRGWLVAASVLAVGLLAAAVGWLRYADHVREQVHIQRGVDPHDVEVLECDGTKVEQVDAEDIGGSVLDRSVPERLVPVFIAAPSFECELFFHVTNPTPRSVIIERLVWPTFGPESRNGVQAVALSGAAPTEGQHEAVFDVDMRVRPNGREGFALRLEASEEGCLSEGALAFFDPPQMTLRTLGLTGDRGSSEPQFGMLGSPSCDIVEDR